MRSAASSGARSPIARRATGTLWPSRRSSSRAISPWCGWCGRSRCAPKTQAPRSARTSRAWTSSGGSLMAVGRFPATSPTRRLERKELGHAGPVRWRLGAVAAALTAWRAGARRDRHAGDPVLLHDDIAQQRQLAAVAVHLELGGADLLAQDGGAVSDRLELRCIEVKRRGGRCGNGFDLDIADAAGGVAGREPERERSSQQTTGKRSHRQTPGGLMVVNSFLSLSEASRMP